jgi:NAD(P)-dependent dehydrogenase (short-subunit alcohol dehydrogenase family)
VQEQQACVRRVALVTGASYGIGAATALALAHDGCDLALTATRVENLSKVAAKLAAMGVRTASVALDVRSQASIEEAWSQAVAAFGTIDVLVNNAGVSITRAALDMTPSEWEGLMQTNVSGTFFMSQQMGRHLVDAHRAGCIINITSIRGIDSIPGRSAYGISKAAVIHMTRMLAIEWARYGIRVNSVAPGRVDTESPTRAATPAGSKALEALVSRVPLRRLATSEEVAAAVRYLASREATYITGHTLVLDGGVTVE